MVNKQNYILYEEIREAERNSKKIHYSIKNSVFKNI